MKQLEHNVEMIEKRAEWRRRTHVADPSPLFQPEVEEQRQTRASESNSNFSDRSDWIEFRD